MANENKDYGLQPYNAAGDTRGLRKIAWHEKHVFPIAKPFLKGTGIDLGCGNGRLNVIFQSYFDELLCVDPICALNKKFTFDNVLFEKCELHELNVSHKYDIVLMMGSFHALHRKYKNKIFKHCSHLVKPGGKIIAMWDAKQICDLENQFFKIINKQTTKDDTSTVCIFERLS